MAKYVENFFFIHYAPRAPSSPTGIWDFIVPSSTGLDVPNSPSVPTLTFLNKENIFKKKLK